ncbi:ubiquitin domain-containing DSK2a-like isoform X1 [Olea europaea subsp. europaea]|nr:ubiquitin domain-containing DSK2a-like isoform X1 [Olea europaea subsp. europaea]
MGSNGGKDIKICENDAAECSETTVEINIKTLDSQIYTLRVNKCVPVPELKKQIASVTGVLSEQQRLICRGKILNDDQLLSAYHGHTLHLVTRQPVIPSSDSSLNQPAADPPSSTGHNPNNHLSTRMVVSTSTIPDNRYGPFSDPSLIGAVLRITFELQRIGRGIVGIDPNRPPSELLLTAPGLTGLRNSSNQQPEQATSTSVPLESLEPSVIPDSLTTLSRFLDNLRQRNGGRRGANSRNSGTRGNRRNDLNADMHSSEQRRLPTPEYLAELMLSTRQIIIERGIESLSQLARQLEGQASVTDLSERSRIQVNALRSGYLFQYLGVLLLELGRIILTLQMGQTPTEVLVNAGPSVFLSSRNLIMPLPNRARVRARARARARARSRSRFVSISIGTVQLGSGFSGGSPASGSLQRAEPSSSRPQGAGIPLSSNRNSDQQDAAGRNLNSSTRESQSQNVSSSQEGAATTGSEEGIFLSNVLRQIMPIISENIGAESNSLSRGQANPVENQADGNQSQRASSRQQHQPSGTESEPSLKR